MMTLPQIIERPAQPYAYIDYEVTMAQMMVPADDGFPRLFDALAKQGITPSGAPIYNYRRIDMAKTLDVEAGVPVSSQGQESEGLRFGVLPAGRFVSLEWHGPFDDLEAVTAVLIGWCRLVGHKFDMREADDGDYFACRLEIFETDPREEPDQEKWVTRLAFKLAD